MLAQPGHQRVEHRRGVAAGQRARCQQGRRRVHVTGADAYQRQRRRLVVDHQRGAGPPGRPHQGRHRLCLREHRDIGDTGFFQRLPQLLGPGMIRPAQPGADQAVILVGQEPVRADDGLGQLPDRIVLEVEDGPVDHVVGLAGRQQDQAGNGACDRNPQNDVHPGSPSAGGPAASNVPASLHCDTVGSTGSPTSAASSANDGTVAAQRHPRGAAAAASERRLWSQASNAVGPPGCTPAAPPNPRRR